MKPEPVRVSDHAVLRYLERAMGLNIDIVRQHILSVCAGPAAIGAVSLRAEGVRFEFSNNVVTTVRPDTGHPSITSRERSQRHIERTERDRIESNLRIDLRPHLQRSARAVVVAREETSIIADIATRRSGDAIDPGIAGFDAHTFTIDDPFADQIPSGS